MKRMLTIPVSQPIGTFYIGKMNGSDLARNTYISRRDYEPDLFQSIGGVQRRESKKRIGAIMEYTKDPDAVFPTPIILSVSTEEVKLLDNNELQFPEDKRCFEIIDGQHRLLGLKESNFLAEFEIPVAILLNTTEEQKAYIFSTINSNQEKVGLSLIYDLFGVTEGRSPFKTCHSLARSFNSDETSPFFQRLKMLGKTVYGEESLTQGTFVNKVIDLISADPKLDTINLKNRKRLESDPTRPLREFFIHEKDDAIYKVLLNYFRAIADAFPREWQDHSQFVLRRTTGFAGLILALKMILPVGQAIKKLDYDFFRQIANNFRAHTERHNIKLTLDKFPSNYKNQARIKEFVLASNKELMTQPLHGA